MCADDVPQVATIEAAQHPVPWSAQSFADALRSGWHCRVLKDELDIVLGYCVTMTAGDDEELLTITVSPDATGHGYGKRLMQDVLTGATLRHARQIFLEVRESNHVAIRLYEQLGFKIAGMRKHYYPIPADPLLQRPAGREHALLMSLSLAGDVGAAGMAS